MAECKHRGYQIKHFKIVCVRCGLEKRTVFGRLEEMRKEIEQFKSKLNSKGSSDE